MVLKEVYKEYSNPLPSNKVEQRDGAAVYRLTDVSLLSTPHLYLI